VTATTLNPQSVITGLFRFEAGNGISIERTTQQLRNGINNRNLKRQTNKSTGNQPACLSLVQPRIYSNSFLISMILRRFSKYSYGGIKNRHTGFFYRSTFI